MYLKFSYNGLKLAVATGKNIYIYSVPEYKLLKQLIGHQGKYLNLRIIIINVLNIDISSLCIIIY